MNRAWLVLVLVLVPMASANYYQVAVSEGAIDDVQRVVASPGPAADQANARLVLLDDQGSVLRSRGVTLAEYLLEPRMECFSSVQVGNASRMQYDRSCAPLLADKTQYFFVQYHPRATKLELRRPPRPPLSADVSRHSNFCGNQVCEPQQSWFSCPQDCDMPVKYPDNASSYIDDARLDGEYYVAYGGQTCGDGSCVRYSRDGVEIAARGDVSVSGTADSLNRVRMYDQGSVVMRGEEHQTILDSSGVSVRGDVSKNPYVDFLRDSRSSRDSSFLSEAKQTYQELLPLQVGFTPQLDASNPISEVSGSFENSVGEFSFNYDVEQGGWTVSGNIPIK